MVTSGIFSLDGSDFEVDNNIWIIGDDREVVVIDAAHDHRPIVAAVADRTATAIVATHGHNDHINAAGALSDSLGAPVWLHPDDLMLWDAVYPDRQPDGALARPDDRHRRRGDPRGDPHPGPLTRRVLPARPGGRSPLLR